MYDELMRCLRHCVDAPEHRGCGANCKYGKEHPLNYLCIPAMMQEAADAIEELTGFVQEAERDRDEYRERLDKANDAIEELAAFKAQITDGRFYVYKLGTLFELKHDPREFVVRYQDPTDPPKEE